MRNSGLSALAVFFLHAFDHDKLTPIVRINVPPYSISTS